MRVRLILCASLFVVVACGTADEPTPTPRSATEIAALTEQVAERFDTSPAMVRSFVGMFATAGGADLDRGAMLAIMLDLPRDEYPDIEDAAAQAAWQLTTR